MNKPINEYHPETVSPPGETLAEKLMEMDMHVTVFARETGIHSEIIYAVIHGNHDITPEMAEAFERITKIPVLFWLERQFSFDRAKRKLTLGIMFGKDQQRGVEKVIKELGDEIRSYETTPDEQGVLFNITFKTENSIYLFGYKNANLFDYLMK